MGTKYESFDSRMTVKMDSDSGYGTPTMFFQLIFNQYHEEILYTQRKWEEFVYCKSFLLQVTMTLKLVKSCAN